MPRVLIADDSDESRYLLEALLQNNGFETISAANGEEALNLAMQHPPEVIITDILMPVMDGYDLCRQWKADDKLNPIPFVFYTATYTDQRDIEFGLSLGAERFLLKPQEPDVILQVLKEVLGEAMAVGVPAKTVSPLGEEMEFFRQHNEVLFRKLEKKMAELEDTNAALKQEITERQQVETALVKAKEAAEAANLAKSRFLANMSHELRTPMTGVLGAIQVALCGSVNDEQRDLLKIANNSGKKLVRIISDILDLTRIEAGNLPIKEKEFVLADSVSDMNDIFIPETRRKGIEIFHDMAPDLPYKVVGDKERLQQILNNLVGNAVKFTEQGKVEVMVRSGNMAPDGRLEIVFTIKDTGVGIPADKRDIIFDFFTQVDDSNTRRYGGTGLGLTISRELVARMGGSIGFESKEGVGSSFFFTIPFEVYDAQDESEMKCVEKETASAVEMGLPRRLLLAEDDHVTRQVYAKYLNRKGYEVDEAPDGLEAFKMWEKGGYDLILMDVQMPHMDGFAATGAIREKERVNGGHTPIVAVTAHAFPEVENRCLAAGMDAYITKPINLKKCIAMIRDLIGKQAQETLTL